VNREANQNGKPTATRPVPWRFGAPGVDPVEIGRRGGIASGVSRRQRPLRELEAKVAESRNGAAQFGLLRLKIEQDQELERARFRADDVLCRLMDAAAAERATIERLQGCVAELEAEFNERHAALVTLEQREAELRQRAESGEGLVDLLRVAHERDRLEPALEELGLFERVEEPA
jgi:hypothetical protein